MLNVMLGLTALGLRNAEADIPLAKVFLDAKVALPRHRRDKRDKLVRVVHVI